MNGTTAGRADGGAAPGAGSVLFGVLAAPAAWFLHLVASFAIAELACHEPAGILALHVVSALFLAVAAAGVLVAARQWRRVRAAEDPAIEAVAGRTRFLVATGLLLSSLFTAIIVAAWVSLAILGGCG